MKMLSCCLFKNKENTTDLQVSDCLAKSLPLQHIVPGFFKHELTACYGHVSDQQALLFRKMIIRVYHQITIAIITGLFQY